VRRAGQIITESWNSGKPTPEFNNAGQIFNHEFYWESMAPNGGGARGLPAAVPLVGCSSAGVLVRGRRHDRDKRLLYIGHLAIAGGQTSRQRAPCARAQRRRAQARRAGS